MASSNARTEANRANAQKSTGPKTADGKTISSKNATTTALTGRTVLLPSDDLAAYERHLKVYHHQFKPIDAYEEGLVQSIADMDWRLQRIPQLMLALLARGHGELIEQNPDLELDSVWIELEVQLKYEKQFRNLQLQENRLQRRRDKEIAQLATVQQERDARRKHKLEVAAKLYLAAEHDGEDFDAIEHGFEFSTHEVECYLNGKRAAQIAHYSLQGVGGEEIDAHLDANQLTHYRDSEAA